MLGAIIGDIVGSRFEFNNHKSKEFELFNPECRYTDDTLMTLAIAKSLLDTVDNYYEHLTETSIMMMKLMGRSNINVGFGGNFYKWIKSDSIDPYYSWGNGAAMRISPIGWAGESFEDVVELSKIVTEITHNHPEGIIGAEAVATTIYLARTGANMNELKNNIDNYYAIDFTLDEIRNDYKFHVSCQQSVPQAIQAFFESTDFESSIRNAISIGGDSDTIAAVTGSIAEAYYGIPRKLRNIALPYLKDLNLYNIIYEFEKVYGNKISL